MNNFYLIKKFITKYRLRRARLSKYKLGFDSYDWLGWAWLGLIRLDVTMEG